MLNHTRDGKPVPAQLITGVGALLMQDGSIGSAMAADLKYSLLHNSGGAGQGDTSEDEAAQEALKASKSLPAACEVVEAIFASQIAKACSMEVEDIDLDKPMHSFGGRLLTTSRLNTPHHPSCISTQRKSYTDSETFV